MMGDIVGAIASLGVRDNIRVIHVHSVLQDDLVVISSVAEHCGITLADSGVRGAVDTMAMRKSCPLLHVETTVRDFFSSTFSGAMV